MADTCLPPSNVGLWAGTLIPYSGMLDPDGETNVKCWPTTEPRNYW